MRRITESTFLLAANGEFDAPPVSGVREYLVPRAAAVTVIMHPLNREDAPLHKIAHWRRGQLVSERTLALPSRPPYTYLLDAIAPLVRPRVDLWIGFNNLSVLNGIMRRRLHLVSGVAYWAVDFVPDRFGSETLLSRAFDRLDSFAARRSDLRVELTAAARDGRASRLGLTSDIAPTQIAPIGLWLDRLGRTDEDAWRKRRIIFSGHLVPRQGVVKLIEAVALLPDVTLDIVGRGPQEGDLRALVNQLGVEDRIRFLGFFREHRDVERIVAEASIAVAPYATGIDSFSQYADPSKIRLYAGVGLPVITTTVPPNVDELVREAGVQVADFDAHAIADAIDRGLSSPDEWAKRRCDALRYSEAFDWGAIVSAVLGRLGFH